MNKKTELSQTWDKISPSYQKRYNMSIDSYYYGPLCPDETELNLLGDVKDKSVLEVGSGAAQNSIYLAKRGAKVTALDISKKQLEYGDKLAKKANIGIDFVLGDFENLSNYFKSSEIKFDIIVSSFALQYCLTVSALNKTFKDIHNLLSSNGVFIFSLDHPIRSHGYWTDEDKFILDNYFDHSSKTWDYAFPEDNLSGRMIGSFKTMGDYINALCMAGFKIDKFLEPEPKSKKIKRSNEFGIRSRYGHLAARDPFSHNHLSRIPGTLIIKSVK